MKNKYGVDTEHSDNILINGYGRLPIDSFQENPMYTQYKESNKNPFVENFLDHLPLANFFVTSSKRYRFRIMSPGFTIAPIRLSIDNHTLYVIASDPGPVVETPVKSIVIFPGERYSLKLQDKKTYPAKLYQYLCRVIFSRQ